MTEKQEHSFSFRWGVPLLDDHYTQIPNMFLRHYAKIGVSRQEFLFILHLASYKYESVKSKCKPSLETIANEMGYAHVNGVRKLAQSLEEKGLLKIHHRPGYSNEYDFASLSGALLKAAQQKDTPTLECTPTPTPECKPPPHPSVGKEEKQEQKAKEKELAASGENSPQDSRLARLQEKFGSDPAEAAFLTYQRKAGNETSFTVPPEAGGANAFQDGPLSAWCALIGRNPQYLNEKERSTWSRELQRVAGLHNADANTMAWALREWGKAIVAQADSKRPVFCPGNIAWRAPCPDTLFQYRDDDLRGFSAFIAPLLEWGNEYGCVPLPAKAPTDRLRQLDLETRPEPPPRID